MDLISLNNLSFVAIKIITRLTNSLALTYTQARPENLDNNLYKYHLDFLQQKGLITKTNNLYSLSDYGKKISQQLSLSSGLESFFKVSVLCYVYDTRLHPHRILLHKRNRHPYFGDVETISGKVRLGESIISAAHRNFLDKTGLNADFTLIGLIRKIRNYPIYQTFEDTFYFVCQAFNPSGNLLTSPPHGDNFWVNLIEAEKLISNNITFSPLTNNLLKLASKNHHGRFFFFDEKLTLSQI